MNIRTVIALVFFLSALPMISAHAGYRNDHTGNGDDITTAIGLQGWYSQAKAQWQISFPYTTSYVNAGTPAGTTGKIESRLDYRKIDSPIFIMSGGANVTSHISFDMVYGFGSISGGRGTDTDRFIPASGGGLEFSRSLNTLDGEVTLWGINFYLNGNWLGTPRATPWGIVLGFQHYEDNLRMRSGLQTVAVTPFDGINLPPAGTAFTSLNSSYDFSWDMLKAGVLLHEDLAKEWSYAASLSAYPFVHYRGEGFWNLRAGTSASDFRMQSPNFVHESSSGYGYEASLELAYALSENTSLRAGYRTLYLYAANGTDTTYFADGAAFTSKLDWVTVTRQGGFAEVLYRF